MDGIIPSQIIPLFESQIFFLTGVTGFLGKVLLHKLLKECPGIPDGGIYVLVRSKKNLSAADRFKEEVLKSSLLFSSSVGRLAARKVKVVDGDIAKSKLGMTPTDYAEIREKCTVVIHMAATVDFNENLRRSVELNVLGARRVLTLARDSPSIKAMVHCSTCYVNSPLHGGTEVLEKIYPISFNAFEMVEKILAMKEDEAHAATPHIIGSHPNTYTFTKCLAEHILTAEKGDLSYSIVRPAIIGSGWKEPLPGWVDSYIGPAGLSLAAGMGGLRVMHGVGEAVCDIVPVDIVANCLLVGAYVTLLNTPGRPYIYHIGTSERNPCRWADWLTAVLGNFSRRPSPKRLGVPMAYFIRDHRVFRLLHQLLHVVPAGAGDVKRIVTGKSPVLLKKTHQLSTAISSLSYFTNHVWHFSTKNTTNLYISLNHTDAKIFNFDVSPLSLDWEAYVVYFSEGLKKFLLKELGLQEARALPAKL